MTTQTHVHMHDILLVGLFQRTTNQKEMNAETAIIGKTIQEYFSKNFSNTIKNRKNPGVTYCIYTEYESDFNGEYTYFIGEEVTDFANNMETDTVKNLMIPAQKYVKFTSSSGKMPAICIDLWQKIWAMDEKSLGGKRSYIADFEIYDERAKDPQNTVLDIYIGIN
jgi:predicted transcriptional regulator YdeE